MIKSFKVDKLQVNVYGSRAEMGAAAAKDVAAAIREVLSEKDDCNVIFAAAPSQNEVLEALRNDKSVDFTRVNAFHMDEYVGLPADAPQGFGNFLRAAIFDNVPFRSVNTIDSAAEDIDAECARYSDILRANPVDIVVLGIGENGHIAFNDPPTADFNDAALVKPVELEARCREQQVHDGCFAKLEDVPTHALTLTVPALYNGKRLFCVVPAATKAEAVRATLTWEISERCPASIMRRHDHAALYLDPDSAKEIMDM